MTGVQTCALPICLAPRVDHRTLEAQGIEREPLPQIPRVALEMERRGFRSVVAERIRQGFEARVRERLERAAAARPADHTVQSAPAEGHGALNLEDIRRQARENWLRLRQEAAERPSSSINERTVDDDLAR